jgi:hypothetical protein
MQARGTRCRSLGLDAWPRRHVPAVQDGAGFIGTLLKIAQLTARRGDLRPQLASAAVHPGNRSMIRMIATVEPTFSRSWPAFFAGPNVTLLRDKLHTVGLLHPQLALGYVTDHMRFEAAIEHIGSDAVAGVL